MSSAALSPEQLAAKIGQTVRYYFEGWRTGRLLEVKGALATIEHPLAGKKPRKVPACDVYELEQ